VTPQVGVNVVCPVLAGHLEPLRTLLGTMGERPADNESIPFGQLAGVHFARLLLLDETAAPDGTRIPAQLLLMADLDAPLEARLAQLVDVAGPGLDAVFGHCQGYPSSGATPESRLAFLRGHVVRSDTHYTNTIGRTVEQVHQEARLREAIEGFLDAHGDWSDQGPAQVRAAVQDFVRCDPRLAWASSPADGRDLGWRLRELVWLVVVPALALLVTLALLPLVLAALAVYVIALRVHESSEPVSSERPSPEHNRQLAAIEDRGPQNQFSAVGFVKPTRFRNLTARAVLWLTDYGTHHVFNHANLAGVRTIHFARWLALDGRRRMIFASSYDGSLESYMDDFIDKVSWGLNATFSNGAGYPRTDFLLFGGARDELAFKSFLRVHQVPTQVWYSAYERLTTLNVENNARIRAGLSGPMSAAGAARWLALL
jgi:hypothetical protein